MMYLVSKYVKKLAKLFSIALLFILIVLFAMLSNHPGQAISLSFFGKCLDQFTDYRLAYTGFKGNIWNDFSFNNLSIYQHQNSIVNITDLHVVWDGTKIVKAEYAFKKINASIELPYQTSTQPSTITSTQVNQTQMLSDSVLKRLIEIQKQLPAMVIESLNINVSHHDIDYQLSGNIDLIDLKGQLNFRQAEHQSTLVLSRDPHRKTSDIWLNVQESTPGILATTLDISKDMYPLSADLRIAAQLTPDSLNIYFDGTHLVFSDHSVQIKGASSLSYNNQVNLDDIQLKLDDGQFNVKGHINENKLYGTIDIDNLNIPDGIIQNPTITNMQINGHLNVDGPWQNPTVKGLLNYRSDVFISELMTSTAKINIENNISSNDKGILSKLNIQINGKQAGDITTTLPWLLLDLQHYNNIIQVESHFDLEQLTPMLSNKITFQQGDAKISLNILHPKQTPILDAQVIVAKGSIKDKDNFFNIEGMDLELTLNKSKDIHLKKLNGSVNKGQFKADASYQRDKLNLNYKFIDVHMPASFATNQTYANAKITSAGKIAGNLDVPIVDIRISAQGLQWPEEAQENEKSIRLESKIQTKENDLLADIQLLNHEDVVSEINLFTSTNTFMENLANGEIDLKIKSLLNLSLVPSLLNMQDLTTKGLLKSNLHVSGKIDSPNLLGEITLEDGKVHQKAIGLDLNNIELIAIADNDKLNIKKLIAHDSEKGLLDIKGNVLLSNPQKLDLLSTLSHFKILNSAKYNGYAQGEIKIDGLAVSPNIIGQLTFNDVNIQIPDIDNDSIDTVEVIDIETYNAKQDQKPLSKVIQDEGQLDIKLDFPKRIFIRGKGLDAELGGHMKLAGSVNAPLVHGYISMKRGSYEFLNKRFKITSGKVGIYEKDITLDFTAEHKAKDLLAIISIKGTPENIKLKLSSSPSLPQDEILARLIFGKDSTSLTPLQALQLANAVRQLTSPHSSNSLDILNETRAFLKVDELEINSSEDSEVSVGAGKYLTDKIYIKGEQGTTSNSTKVTVNVEVTDNITLESSTGADTKNNNIKVFWKKKY